MRQSAPLKSKANHLPSPANDPGLARLIQRGYVFNARQQEVADVERMPTGYAELDKLLSGGLGLGALHEIQTPKLFAGENLLFKAALQQAHSKQQAVFWLNPPAQPFLTGLQATRARHTVIDTLSDTELQWAARQILTELQEGVVLIWQSSPSAETIRHWQRAIKPDSQVYALVICEPMPQEARAYCNRIRLNQAGDRIFFEVLKRQGGWPAQTTPERLRAWS